MRRYLLLAVPLLALTTAFACSSAGGAAPDDGTNATSAGGSNGAAQGGASGAGGGMSAGGAGGNANVLGGGGALGTGGGPPIDPDAGCAYASFSAARVPASILIVMDRSGSMSDAISQGAGDKWSAAVTAIDAALDGAADDLQMGIERFPEGKFDDSMEALCILQNPPSAQCQALLDDGGCKDIASPPNIPVGPLSMTRTSIESFLGSTSPSGNTPTLWALKDAWDYMAKVDVKGDRYVLLVTDGLPTTYTPAMLGLPEMNKECGSLADIGAATTAAREGMPPAVPPVKTFVIGVPGDNDATVLSGIAYNGGTGKPGCDFNAGNCHFQIGTANFGKDLQDALTQITGKVTTCVFEVPQGMNVEPTQVNVELDTPMGSQPVLKDTSHMDGWDYTDASDTKIEIYGPACDAIQANASSKVQVLLGCMTVVK